MATTIAREQRQAAKRHIIAQIEQGASVQTETWLQFVRK